MVGNSGSSCCSRDNSILCCDLWDYNRNNTGIYCCRMLRTLLKFEFQIEQVAWELTGDISDKETSLAASAISIGLNSEVLWVSPSISVCCKHLQFKC